MKTLFAPRALAAAFSWLRCLPVCLALLAVVAPVRATTVIPPDFDQLVSQADYIVRAVVKSVNSEMRTDGQHRHIVTKVELEVRQVISGTPPQPLVLEMLGGTVDGETMVVEGAPRFKVGDEDILFVHGNGRNFSPLVAMMHGRYPIKRDGVTGREFVARSNGAPLFSEQDVALPMSHGAPAQVAEHVASEPLSPADFVSRIQNAINQSSRTKLEN